LKNYKKYIFDLDYTLLIPNWSREDEYLKEHILLEEQEEFFKQKQAIMDQFEIDTPRFDLGLLSEYFLKHGFHVSEDVCRGWMSFNGQTITDKMVDGVVDLFKYLKENNKEIVVLTNWFSETQIPRLKRAGLYDYIDTIITGEEALKPSIEPFILAIDKTDKADCIMIGDSIETDKTGALNVGIDYYIVDDDHSMRDLLNLMKQVEVK
jgi:HAD superfamily hydrolase (TIGR01549 family)